MKGEFQTAMLVAVSLALATLALSLDQLRVPPENRLARPELLTKAFERIVFDSEFHGETEWVAKWSPQVPTYIRLHGDVSPSYRDYFKSHARVVSKLTGLWFVFTDEPPHGPSTAFMEAHFGPWRELPKVMRKYDPFYEDEEFVLRRIRCAASIGSRYGISGRAYIYVPTDRGHGLIRKCILEEFVQSLGLPKDVELIKPSMFSNKAPTVELTLNDKVLVRTLYDDRITPEMARAEAMRHARDIIRELSAAFRRDGEAALTHPRYVARGTGE